MTRREAPWIPPEPLIFAQVSLLVSWCLLFAVGAQGAFGPSPLGFAWIHTIALGWLSSTAMAFLIHVLPTFLDAPLRFPRLARSAPWIFQAGTIAIVAGFAIWAPKVVAAGGALVLIAVTFVLASFLATAAAAMRDESRTTRAVARAFTIVFCILGLTIVLGFTVAIGLNLGSTFVSQWARIHAALGTIGWLSLLVAGVSARTYNQLLGRAPGRVAHIATSSFALAGLAVWIAGSLLPNAAVAVAGGALVAIGAFIYLCATVLAVREATAKHRLPREFVAASAFWLCVAVAYGVAELLGRGVPSALLFAILVGWIGQNVNAHMMHVGIRLLATLVIGDDDETRPIELLDRRLGIASFVLYQLAVACAISGLTISDGTLLEAAGVLGFVGTLTVLANIASARRAAASRRDALANTIVLS